MFLLSSILLFLLPILGRQQPEPNPGNVASGPALVSHMVPGLKLTPDQTVSPDEGFVLITAEARGDVKWLVLGTSGTKIKYTTAGSSLIVSVPRSGQILVYAVALDQGKLTEFARTTITVASAPPQPGPGPAPGPAPAPLPSGTRLHVTIVEDPQQRTPDLAALLNSASLRKSMADLGHTLRVYDSRDPSLKTLRLDLAVNRVGTLPVLIIQSSPDGVVRLEKALPRTEAELLAAVKGVVR